jgi:hypothetical protein
MMAVTARQLVLFPMAGSGGCDLDLGQDSTSATYCVAWCREAGHAAKRQECLVGHGCQHSRPVL